MGVNFRDSDGTVSKHFLNVPYVDIRLKQTGSESVAEHMWRYMKVNGGEIIDMKELDELDKQKALYQLMSKLNEAEISIHEEGTISADDLEKELGV